MYCITLGPSSRRYYQSNVLFSEDGSTPCKSRGESVGVRQGLLIFASNLPQS